MIDKKLLEVLVCPQSKAKLFLVGEELFCLESKLAYPINDGIPILLVKHISSKVVMSPPSEIS